jgi:hypothetical protein
MPRTRTTCRDPNSWKGTATKACTTCGGRGWLTMKCRTCDGVGKRSVEVPATCVECRKGICCQRVWQLRRHLLGSKLEDWDLQEMYWRYMGMGGVIRVVATVEARARLRSVVRHVVERYPRLGSDLPSSKHFKLSDKLQTHGGGCGVMSMCRWLQWFRCLSNNTHPLVEVISNYGVSNLF